MNGISLWEEFNNNQGFMYADKLIGGITVGNDIKKKLIDIIMELSYKHDIWKVFSDFVEVSAIALSNGIDPTHKEEREQRYMELIKTYSKEELNMITEAFACLAMEAELSFNSGICRDILGGLFHELELHNKYKGQFFTPSVVCELMAAVTVADVEEQIKEKGYITVSEPCTGSGAMVLGIAKVLMNKNISCSSQMVVTAIDVDLKCVCMTYIQLSLYGIPAVVIHGNTLTTEEWSRWYTPAYVLDGWIWREPCGITSSRNKYDEMLKSCLEPTYGAIRKLFGYGKEVSNSVENEAETEDKNNNSSDCELVIVDEVGCEDIENDLEKQYVNINSPEINTSELSNLLSKSENIDVEYSIANNGQLSLF